MRLIDRFRIPTRDDTSPDDVTGPGGTLLQFTQSWGPDPSGHERTFGDFVNYAANGLQRNVTVFACIQTRMLVFTEAVFKWRQQNNGRPGDLFGTQPLALLENPWPNGSTGDLLARMELDVSLAGNSYTRRNGTRLQRLRPDWVEIITDPELGGGDGHTLGYIYHPYGVGMGDPILLMPDEVAHYAPLPDPLWNARGMSWLSPVIREIDADSDMTNHKSRFLRNAATPNLLIKVEGRLPEDLRDRIRADLAVRHEGVNNAYKTMLLEGGADATVVGSNLQQMDFKTVQGGGETRVAAAAGVPPVIVGFSEGLAAATYSNYSQARRRFMDGTIRPLWRSAAAALESLFQPFELPNNAHLWYDDRDIPFLREDLADAAAADFDRAKAIDMLVRAGYDPDTVTQAVTSSDFSRLKHTGAVPTTVYENTAPGAPDAGMPDTPAGGGTSTGLT